MHPGTDALRQEARASLTKPLRAEEVAPVLERLLQGRPASPGPPWGELEARLPFRQQITAVLLPRPPESPPPAPAAGPGPTGPPPAPETILVVEDHPGVRGLVVQVLRQAGYTLLVAQQGAEAVETCRRHPGRIHLLITDLVLPRLGGREVALAVAALQPGLKVLFMSGYPAADAPAAGLPVAASAFLEKPFTLDVLLEKVRALLAEGGGRDVG